MVIKFNDNFDSIFHAILYSSLTGYYLSPMTESNDLLGREQIINIERLNWPEIVQEHSYKFGEIKWLNTDKELLIKFKNNIDYALRYWKPYKYKIIINAIREAIRFGLGYLQEGFCDDYNQLVVLVAEVKAETKLALGKINFIPVVINKEKFLAGFYAQESLIGDLIINLLERRYFGYSILLKTPELIYFNYKDKLFELSAKNYKIEINNKSFSQFWNEFKKKVLIPQMNHVLI